MNTNIYVGNLSYETTQDDLGDLFSTYGDVESVNVITDRETGRSKGFGFVTMTSEENTLLAIKELDGKSFNERDLKVNLARERQSNSSRRY